MFLLARRDFEVHVFRKPLPAALYAPHGELQQDVSSCACMLRFGAQGIASQRILLRLHNFERLVHAIERGMSM